MSNFKSNALRRGVSRTILSLGFLAVTLIVACSLDEGNGFNQPRDPTVIIDPTTINASVFVDPSNVPADGESYSTIHARLMIDGAPAIGVPVLFYSEWGTVFTACGTPTTVTLAAFTNSIITGTNGEASTLIQAPVLPNLYRNEQESNTVAAFFLINGIIYRVINNQNLWQVDLASINCKKEGGNRVTVTSTFSGRGTTYPVSACDSVDYTVTSNDAVVTARTLCSDRGRTSATVEFNNATVNAITLQVVGNFNGAGLNECVLDENRSLSVVGHIRVNRSGSCSAI